MDPSAASRRVVRLGRAVGQDHHLVAVRLVAVGDARRNLHETVVVLAEEDLLEFAFGRRAFAAGRTCTSLARPRQHGVVDRHRLWMCQALIDAGPRAREVDLAELHEVRVGRLHHVHDLAALVDDLPEGDDLDAVDHSLSPRGA